MMSGLGPGQPVHAQVYNLLFSSNAAHHRNEVRFSFELCWLIEERFKKLVRRSGAGSPVAAMRLKNGTGERDQRVSLCCRNKR